MGTAAILCGGKSSRMGFDKALLEVNNNELLLSRTIHLLLPFFQKILLITNDCSKFANKITITSSKLHYIEDHYSEKGPLGAICTALESSNDSNIFVMAGDLAYPNTSLITEMNSIANSYDIVLCRQEEKLEPLFGFYSQSCLPVFQRQLAENDLKIRTNFFKFAVFYLPLGKEYEKSFINLNYPKDLSLL